MTETTAVLDRFEGDRAVLVTDDGRELHCDPDRLPPDGRAVDAVFRVVTADDDLREATYLPDETDRRAEHARSRFDRLSSRLGSASGPAEEGDDPTDAPDGGEDSTDASNGSDDSTDRTTGDDSTETSD